MSRNPSAPLPKMANVDLMAAGDGTPWEDRGQLGFIQAYFKTVFLSMTSPASLTDSMRRPEMPNDVTRFAFASGFAWTLGVLSMAIVQYVARSHITDPQISFVPPQFWENTAIEAVAAFAGTWVALKISSTILHKIISPDLPVPVPNVLIYNVMGYALGPSILAVIPYAGPPLAAVWIFVNWIILAVNRLRAKKAGAITASIITLLALGIGFGAVVGIGSLIGSSYVLGWNSIVEVPPNAQTR